MAWRLAVLAASAAGALAVLAAGSEEACAAGASCPSGAPAGEEDEAGLLQVGRGEAGDDGRTSQWRPHAAQPPVLSANFSLLASAVSRALAARQGRASAPTAGDVERSIRSHHVLAVADVLSAAIEDSVLPDEAKELATKQLKDPSSSTSVALVGVVGKIQAGHSQAEVAEAVHSALSGADSGFIPDWISKQIQDMISSNAGGFMDKLKSATSSGAAQTMKDTFGVDICDLPFDIPGFSKSACSSSSSSCSTDTGGTCSFGSCSSSRNAACSGGKCVCSSGSCAKGGQCVSTPTPSPGCPVDTGGTCNFGSCSSSRNAVCSNGRCVCSSGTCAQGGQCVSGR